MGWASPRWLYESEVVNDGGEGTDVRRRSSDRVLLMNSIIKTKSGTSQSRIHRCFTMRLACNEHRQTPLCVARMG
jgi:hypothetical protein